MICVFVFVGAKKSGKQSLLNFKPVATKPKKSESLDEELDEDSDSAEMAVVPRERVERKAKGEYRGFSSRPGKASWLRTSGGKPEILVKCG